MGAQKVTLSTADLNVAAQRLFHRADEVNQITLADLSKDLRLAGQACEWLVKLKAEISAIADKCRDQDAARELRDLLDDEVMI